MSVLSLQNRDTIYCAPPETARSILAEKSGPPLYYHMKGIVLAGGLGTRLAPLTLVTNKCLLPVYDRPMIHWPIQTLVDSGIKDILLVCGGNAAGEFLRILGNGEDFGLKKLNYAYQSEPRGIADALRMAEEWAGDESIAVILADNIFENPCPNVIVDFEQSDYEAAIFITEVDHPEWYGVVELASDTFYPKVKSIVEKPKNPKTNFIVTGLYFYKSSVWNFIESLTPSVRGELEITDLNNYFLKEDALVAHPVEGYWGDAGESIDVYLNTCVKVAELRRKNEPTT